MKAMYKNEVCKQGTRTLCWASQPRMNSPMRCFVSGVILYVYTYTYKHIYTHYGSLRKCCKVLRKFCADDESTQRLRILGRNEGALGIPKSKALSAAELYTYIYIYIYIYIFIHTSTCQKAYVINLWHTTEDWGKLTIKISGKLAEEWGLSASQSAIVQSAGLLFRGPSLNASEPLGYCAIK